MHRKISSLICLCSLAAIACLSVSAQKRGAAKTRPGVKAPTYSFTSLSKREIEMLLTDVAKTNPAVLKYLAEDPAARQEQLKNLRELLAFANQALRDGSAKDPVNRQELESIRSAVIASSYDKEVNKGKEPTAPFGLITEAQVKRFWSGNHEAEFQRFLDAKLSVMERGSLRKGTPLTGEELTQARDFFAKIEIYEKEFDAKRASGKLARDLIEKSALQVKLQQAQFLARLYAEKAAEKTKATDADIAKYIAEHPRLDRKTHKAKAEQVLKRALGGEDFAALANEFSQDPGNTDSEGTKYGGLYRDVPEGRMVPSFERAALALVPGQVAPNVVESDFGYHVIKLEKKGQGKDDSGKPSQIYDVRHILISTTVEDPANVNGRDIPVREYVQNTIEAERERQLMDKIVAENDIRLPADFTVPVTGGEMPTPVKKAPLGKKRPVKKGR
jgi:hypothetical protein